MDYKEFMFRMYVKEIEADIIDPNGFSHKIGNTVTCKCGGHYEFRQKKKHYKTYRHFKYFNKTQGNNNLIYK
jgi:hypothetical protein